ncbi:acetate--CoA ligase family protein [Rhodococcus sp. JS3073]|uniref:acetate--CoA ligase family protein n=1 Tax=Rhodococcus sp. JS3073 TaxID=3002901 RepID=UPI0022864759|nr:acetate--CoA ligase family protein [Rhodococcus sp. JS3073]WAM14666.1 acetate--CoA ligase family protein [Rhodococcus sp. JS3073]
MVGVSATQPLSWGRLTLDRLLACGFSGELVAVGPQAVESPSVVSVRSLSELNAPPDLVVVATPADAAPGVLAEASAIGVVAAVVFSAGFSEAGDTLREQRLREAAGDMAVLGPNCLGIVNHAAGIQLSTSGFLGRSRRTEGPVAIITQSGALGFVLADLLEKAEIGYTYYASVGNEMCLTTAVLGQYLVERPEVETIVLYLEGVRDAAGLRELGERARTLGKTVVALAVGSSEGGRRSALSHTAAVAGDYTLLSALCTQAGILLVRTDDELVDAVLCGRKGCRLPESPAFAVLTMSGGAGGVLADSLTTMGARIPPLSEPTRRRIAEIGTVEAGDLNPIDLGGNFFRSLDSFHALIGVLDEADEIDAVVVYLTFGDYFVDNFRDIAETCAATATPTWFIWAGAPEGEITRSRRPETVIPSIGAFVRRTSMAVRPASTKPVEQDRGDRRSPALRRVLTELHAAPVLSEAGIRHVPMVAATTPEGVVAAIEAADWAGTRMVVKGDSSQAPHRAHLGLLRIDIARADLLSAAAEIHARLNRSCVDDEARLVAQPLVEHRAEIALGAVRDPIYGTAVVLGAGGARAEDHSAPRHTILLPATPQDIDGLATWASSEFDCDAASIAAAIRSLIAVLHEHPEYHEIDINPLCVVDGGLVAVDALITLTDTP